MVSEGREDPTCWRGRGRLEAAAGIGAIGALVAQPLKQAARASKPFHARNLICGLFTVGEVCCGSLGVCCAFGFVFRRLSCGCVVFSSSALDEFSEWSAMVSKLRRGVLGSRARSELKEYWQMRSVPWEDPTNPDSNKAWEQRVRMDQIFSKLQKL